MPELPEVETVKQTLQHLIAGKTITDITVLSPRIVQLPDDISAFRFRLIGQTIERIERRGKFLKLICNEDVLVSHLRMEGRYQVMAQDAPYDKHTHVRFAFADGSELRYRDVRKFGTMHVFVKGVEEQYLPLHKLGPEPLGKSFTQAYMMRVFAKTTRTIKAVLLDQTVVAGLGNIYVDEALFRAGIHPESFARDLCLTENRRLHRAIRKILREAIANGGSTVRSYLSGSGEMGMFQQNLFVYARNGQPCKVCGTPVKKQLAAGRGTHFCPACQRKKED